MPHTNASFLYFDDDIRSVEVLEIILKKIMGFSNFDYFLDSEDYPQKINELTKRPDIVFLDIHIPPHNGYEVLQWFQNNPAYSFSKVVALTASVMVQDVTRLQEAGFDGLIGKPLSHKTFPRLLEQILSGEDIWYIP
jgi:CheY-like chemotaxis protein